MSEFCLDCWNEINGTNYSKNDYILSEDLDLCEGCNEWKNVIVSKKEFKFISLRSIYNHIFKK